MDVPENINEAANAVADSLNAMVFVYSGAIDHEGFGGLVKTLEPSDQQPLRPNAILFLTTHGGHAGLAYRIARLLQSLTKNFYLCVPSECKSAGTLIALGANEIYMPLVSELGPLDAQFRRRDEIVGRRSGMVVRTALDGLADETFKVYEKVMLGITRRSGQTISFDVSSRIASTVATGVMAPVYAQIDPQSLGNDLRDLSVAKEYGNRLVAYGGNATEETVTHLVEGYPEHEFIIDSAEAKGLFNQVNDPTDEMNSLILALGETVYSVQKPHAIRRLDGNFEEGEINDDGTDPDGNGAAGVAEGRKAPRRGNRKREPKETEDD